MSDDADGGAGIVSGLAKGIAKTCPKAWVAIISNPVNSTVPIVAEVFKQAGEPFQSGTRGPFYWLASHLSV